METVKFVCEFFFDDFSHFAGLLVLILAVSGTSLFKIKIKD